MSKMEEQQLEMQLRIWEDFCKKRNQSQLRVEEDYCKTVNQLQAKDRNEVRKIGLQEFKKERRKAQVESVYIDDTGIPRIFTQNVACGKLERRFTNMQYPHIVEVKCAENMTQKIYILETYIYPEQKWVVLNPKKCGTSTYLLRALTSIGVTVLGNGLAMQKANALQLIEFLCSAPEKRVVLPEKQGWYEVNGILKFYDKEYTWRWLLKCMVR